MIDDIIDGNNTDAKDSFETIISNKLTDALDAKKIEIAQAIYSKEKEEEEEEIEEDEPVPSEE